MKSFATILVYCLFYFRSSRNWSEEERFVLRTFINKYNKELQQVQKSTADARISAESSLLYINLTV